jgi:hypothetical protein
MTQILNQRRPFYLANPAVGQFYGPVDMYVTDGTQRYNGLLLSVSRRASSGTTLTANYALGHCYGSPNGSGGGTANLSTGYNLKDDHHFDDGNCETDRRHIFTLTAGVESPRLSGGNAALRALGSGWRLVGSFRALSGQFLNVVTGSDIALNGQFNAMGQTQRVNQVLDDPFADRSINPVNGGMRYLNPSAFAQPALGTLGNLKRHSIEGIGNRNLDLALSRQFRLGNSQALEFRAEAFNAFNWFQWLQPGQLSTILNPVVNLSSPTFGQITTAGDPRILQFALKYVF